LRKRASELPRRGELEAAEDRYDRDQDREFNQGEAALGIPAGGPGGGCGGCFHVGIGAASGSPFAATILLMVVFSRVVMIVRLGAG